MTRFTVEIPDFDKVTWTVDADGVSDASFNGIDISVCYDESSGEWCISHWVFGDLYDGDDSIDYSAIATVDDARYAAYEAAMEILHERLLDFGAVCEEAS